MKRVNLLAGFFGLALVFITIQIYLWKSVNEKDKHHNKVSLSQFIAWSLNNVLPVFIIDANTLNVFVSKNITTKRKCYILCKSSDDYITLGIDAQFLTQQLEILKQDYLAECDHGTLPVTTNGSTVPVHCFIETPSLTIHIVVFHELNNELWWHGQVSKTHNKIRSTFGDHPGLFERIATRKVQLDGLQLRIPKDPKAFLEEMAHSRFIPCNSSRAKDFVTRYGMGETEDSKYFTLKAIQLLKKSKKVLDELGIPFWLSSGTCLGWFRQCDIIPYTTDVDLGVFIKYYKAFLIPTMQNSGLNLKYKFGKVKDSFELSFQEEKIKLDIFFFYEEKDYMWNGGTQASTGNKYKYIFPKFTLCWTLFYNMKVRVPCQTQSYIEANYGSKWYEPVKTWDWKASPPNVHENGVWPAEELDDVINLYV